MIASFVRSKYAVTLWERIGWQRQSRFESRF